LCGTRGRRLSLPSLAAAAAASHSALGRKFATAAAASHSALGGKRTKAAAASRSALGRNFTKAAAATRSAPRRDHRLLDSGERSQSCNAHDLAALAFDPNADLLLALEWLNDNGSGEKETWTQQ